MSSWTVLRLAVIGLILCGGLVVVAVTLLLWSGGTAPDGLIAIGATAVGALATLMVHQTPTPPPPSPPDVQG